MKKSIFILIFMPLFATIILASCTQSMKIKHDYKKDVVSEAKNVDVKVKFNELKCIKIDTIPNEFNWYAISALNDFKRTSKLFDSCLELRSSIYPLIKYGKKYEDEYNEVDDRLDSLMEKLTQYDNKIKEELKYNKKTCYVLFSDALMKDVPVFGKVRAYNILIYNEDGILQKSFTDVGETEFNSMLKKYSSKK